MLDAGVEVNALATVNDYSVRFPEEIYAFHKALGLRHMQFIPVVETAPDKGRLSPHSVSAEAFGDFLCTTFDLWLADFDAGLPTTSIRFFDSVFYPYVNLPPPECTLAPECGMYVVVEHNGDVFACDFFVEPAWKLGNVMEGDLTDMLNSERQAAFGRIKSNLPEACRRCEWLAYCRGGCPKDRVRPGKEGAAVCHLCPAFKAFFEHAHPTLRQLAARWRAEHAGAPREEEDAHPAGEGSRHEAAQAKLAQGSRRQPMRAGRGKVGRNDPCPCGSGLKFKKCCGA
jgi:uncharacterized protein